MSRATLRRRVVLALAGLAAGVCLVYSVLAFLFVYAVEDEFFGALLANEAKHVASELSAGRVAQPRLPFVKLYRGWASVPAEVRSRASPSGREVAGENGRHYHLRRVHLPTGDAWLVGEVSELLAVRPMRTTLLKILLPATLLVLVCSFLVAIAVARRTVRQLTALVAAVQRNDAPLSGALGGEAADDEIRVLAEALETAFARLHAALQREKTFTGDVSHELRTPIAVIAGAAELLARTDLDSAARARVRRILDAAHSSEEIIELLLALAREETMRETHAEVPLLALVERLVLRHRDLQGRTDIDVHVAIPPQLRILVPPVAAEVVIANLVTNALRHGTGAVEITAEESSVIVRNSGTGSVPDTRAGRGIGLDLVRRLCNASGFELELHSSSGTTTATLRLSRSRSCARTSGPCARPSSSA